MQINDSYSSINWKSLFEKKQWYVKTQYLQETKQNKTNDRNADKT